MDEKYEEKLWGQVDFLHQKSKRQQIAFNYLLEMLRAFQEGFFEFSKVLENMQSKHHDIIENHSTSMHDSAEKFLRTFETITREYKDAYNNIRKQIVDPINKPTNEMFTKENELYKSYVKYRNQYNNSKLSIDKNYQNYESSLKLCENLLFNSKQMDTLTSVAADKKKKNEKKANESIKTARIAEEKYRSSIDFANTARELEIKKQEELLQYYQKLDIYFYEKVKFIFGLYLALLSRVNKNISSSIENLGKSYQQISVENDIKLFINESKCEKKLQKVSIFTPYVPSYDPTNKKIEQNKLDICYEVIKILKSNFKDIRNDLNMEEETNKKRIRFLCEKILKTGNNITLLPEEKKELMSLLENPSNIKDFLIILSNQTIKGKLKRTESLIRDLSDLLLKVLKLAEKEKDYENAKSCIFLSKTFYYEQKVEDSKKNDGKGEEMKKIFLFDLIKNNKWIKSMEFWERLIEETVEGEVKRNEELSKKQGIKENEKTKQIRLSNICFTLLLNLSSNMTELGLNKEDIVKIVDKFAQKYGISKELSASIYSNIEMKHNEIQSSLSTNQENIIRETNENKESNEIKEKTETKEIIKEQKKDENKDNKVIIETNENKEKKEEKKEEEKKEDKKEEIIEIKKEEKVENNEEKLNKDDGEKKNNTIELKEDDNQKKEENKKIEDNSK